ncbi:MAG: fibronectin type III domain-containing protein, partial [Ruminococcus sp.]|nr:fibronectin type III domain-containing protein [Ruminococcus sp.]
RATGTKLEKSADLAANYNSYGVVAPLAADGKIFVAMGNGTIQAFDAKTFKSLWVYHDELGGQALTEMVYKDGYIYTGFWNGETADANYVCIPTEDKDTSSELEEQAAAWKYTTTGGYYWAGAYVTDDLVIFGTDNGESDGESKGSKVVAVKRGESIEKGEAVVASEADDLFGDLRSAVSYDEQSGYYFVTSKGKLLIRFRVDGGEIKNVQTLQLPGASTSTPVAANGRVYVGVCGSGAYTEYSGHQIAVIDANKFEIVYGVQTNGYCQSSALVANKDGENYVYFTANYTPGKVYVLHDNASMTAPEKTEKVKLEDGTEIDACPTLFTPVGDHANYCLGSVLTDDEGTLYFRNDSGAIFALGSRLDKVEITGKTLYKEGEKLDKFTVTAKYANGAEKDITDTAIAGEGNTAEELKAGKGEVSFGYDGMLYGDTDTEAGHEYDTVYGELEYLVLSEEDYKKYEEVKAAIDAIGEVKLSIECGKAIQNARRLYDALGDDVKPYVDNVNTLAEAETKLNELLAEWKAGAQVTVKDKFTCTATKVRINWEKVENADVYEVYFLNKETKKYDLVGKCGSAITTFAVSDLKPGTKYKFKVRAYSVAGKDVTYGKFSKVKVVATKPDATQIVKKNCISGKKTIKVGYKKVSGADGYLVQRYDSSKKKWVNAVTVKNGKKTLAAVKNLKPGKVYKFRIRAFKTVDGTRLYAAASKAVNLATKK